MKRIAGGPSHLAFGRSNNPIGDNKGANRFVRILSGPPLLRIDEHAHSFLFTKREISFASLSGLLPKILERFQVVDDVCHGSPHASATTNRRQI